MKLQDQVCTLEQAKKLKELGVKQDSYFSWCGDETHRVLDNAKDGLAVSIWIFISTTHNFNNQHGDYRSDVPSAKPFASAFTVSELGELLPDEYRTKDELMSVYTYWTNNAFGEGKTLYFPSLLIDVFQCGFETEAQARAAMLIYLLENKQ